MASQTLREARKYEEMAEAQIPQEALCAGLSSGRLVLENTEVFGSAAAIFSVLAKDLTEYLLWGDEEDIVD